jgi:hypothetical protein
MLTAMERLSKDEKDQAKVEARSPTKSAMVVLPFKMTEETEAALDSFKSGVWIELEVLPKVNFEIAEILFKDRGAKHWHHSRFYFIHFIDPLDYRIASFLPFSGVSKHKAHHHSLFRIALHL